MHNFETMTLTELRREFGCLSQKIHEIDFELAHLNRIRDIFCRIDELHSIPLSELSDENHDILQTLRQQTQDINRDGLFQRMNSLKTDRQTNSRKCSSIDEYCCVEFNAPMCR